MHHPISDAGLESSTGLETARILRLSFLGASVVLYGASLFQDAVYTAKGGGAHAFPASLLLLAGWLGLFSGMAAWLANPLLAATWGLMLSRRTRFAALPCAFASFAFALSFLRHDEIMTSEAPTYSRITGYGPGYWLWVGSIATALTSCIVGVCQGRAR